MIVGELPTHLAQSLFSKPVEYPVAMRYSSEPGDPALDDRIPQPRGVAMKVFNVEGEMFDIGKDYPTQDIEFNSAPAIELADAKTTREIFELRTKYGGDQKELYKHLEARKDADLQKARDQVPNKRLEVCICSLLRRTSEADKHSRLGSTPRQLIDMATLSSSTLWFLLATPRRNKSRKKSRLTLIPTTSLVTG